MSTVLNLDRYISVSVEIPVFYPKRYDKCKILPDISLNRYWPIIALWPIYWPIYEMNMFDKLSHNAFKELLQTHLRSFYKK